LYIGRTGLVVITTKFWKVIICFETGGTNIKREFIRRTSAFFPNIKHHLYVIERAFKYLFKKFLWIIENDKCINVPILQPLNTCIVYYSKFVNNYPPITEDLTIEFILISFLNNANIIALIHITK
jgi:hypothetical protein